MKRSIGLAALTVRELRPHEQVSVAAQTGYDFVGLRLIPVAGQVLPPFDERETERRLADTGLRVLDVEVFRLEPGTNVAAFEPTLAAASRLRASEILVHGADPEESRLVDAFSAPTTASMNCATSPCATCSSATRIPDVPPTCRR